MPKICLFTAHSPSAGGGSVILRSLVEYLPEISFTWKYTGQKKIPGYEEGYLGTSFMGENILKDVWQSWRMINDLPSREINKVVQQLLDIECETYWIVSHNEGLRIALELARQQTERPVHLTVHDDWGGALSARSYRYRLLANAATTMTIKVLHHVNSYDVISRGMQKYYQQISDTKGEVCHRYLPPEMINISPKRETNRGLITAGHIGSVYDKKDFLDFMYLLKEFAASKSLQAEMHMWGSWKNNNGIPSDLRNIIHLHAELPEEQVIPQLATFDFVYAMYPLKKKMEIFSATSLPTKLTSYLQCGRPVFGHARVNSTLSEFLATTRIGATWSSNEKGSGTKTLEEVLNMELKKEQLENARKEYFGEKNLRVMQNYFVQSLKKIKVFEPGAEI